MSMNQIPSKCQNPKLIIGSASFLKAADVGVQGIIYSLVYIKVLKELCNSLEMSL